MFVEILGCAILLIAHSAGEDAKFLYNEEELVNANNYPELFPGADVEHYHQKRALAKCYDDLGCFENDQDFFHVLKRPIKLYPQDREKINTKFLLYTRKNIKQYHELRAKNPKSIESSDFNPELDTKIITHGYLDNQLFGEWMRQMKNEFLMHGDYNVILVDWSGGNGLPYAQATTNTRLVGAEVALLVNYLKDNYKLKPEKVHILGHSLGSHIAGYAGERIQNLARITAMDPAEPFFQGLPPKVRIDPTDAQFVDVIHSDSKSILLLGFGMSDLVGHVDFFPNDGMDHPGCKRISSGLISIVVGGLGEAARRFVACNHQRSIDFMTDSINNLQCQMVGFACKDYAYFRTGVCYDCGKNSEKCATLGLNAINYKPRLQTQTDGSTSPVKLYFSTSDKSPFCLFHYHLSLKLKKGEGITRTGGLHVTLRGKKKDETFKDLGDDDKITLTPGSTYTFLLTTSKELGDIEAVSFGWKTKKISIITKHTIFLEWLKIIPMNTEDRGLQTSMSKSFCSESVNPITSGKDVNIIASQKC